MKIRDLMTSKPRTIESTARLQEAAIRMKEANVGTLPVMEDGKLVGIVTDRDLVIRGLAEGGSVDSVRQVMSTNWVALDQHTDVDHAIETMEIRGIGRLLVLDEVGRLTGIITASDIAMGVAGDARAGRLAATLGQVHHRPHSIVSA